MGITVENGGILTTVQDEGRFGNQAFGVSTSGAMDPHSFHIANLLVGNEMTEGALEMTFIGPTLTFTSDNIIAVTGGDLTPMLDGQPFPMYRAVLVKKGQKLMFAGARNGSRGYIAFAGGLDIPLSYAEIVHMNNYCVETSEETGKSYTPVELPDPKPEDEEAIVGTYHLNGVQATSYCRIRYTASLDMGRTERQRRVIQMIVDKAKKAGLSTIFDIMDQVFPMVTTSVSKTEILKMIPTVIGYSIDETTGFPTDYKFATVKGSVIVATTLESNVLKVHQFLYGNTNYSPTQDVLNKSAQIVNIAGDGDAVQDSAPAVTDVPNDATDDSYSWQGDESVDYSADTDTDYSSDTDYSGSSDYDSDEDYSGGGYDTDYSDTSDDYSGGGYYDTYDEYSLSDGE